MDDINLIERLTAYGADVHGIHDRFGDDTALYAECVSAFLIEPHFAMLEQAVAAGDCGAAFEAAHALKGLSGNLGLTPFYEAVCTLVEALRQKDTRDLTAQHAEVVRQRKRVQAYAAGEPCDDRDDSPTPRPGRTAKMNRRRLRLVIMLVAFVALVAVLFILLVKNFKQNTNRENAGHLEEINYQIKLYIEERTDNDWRLARSVAESMVTVPPDGDTDALYAYMRQCRDVWGVSDIILYTESGFGISTDGSVLENDQASETLYRANRFGENMAIVQSSIIYTVPLRTSRQIQGEYIAAVSIVRKVDTFLDDMDFSSFDNKAYLYLTQKDGAVVSSLTHPDMVPTYNVLALLENRELTRLSHDDADDAETAVLSSAQPVTYLMSDGIRHLYLVSTPIRTQQDPLRLFYFVPEAIVNQHADSFFVYVVWLSVVVILIFLAAALFAFLYISRIRQARFDRAVQLREHLLDLLVKNTHTTFGLFDIDAGNAQYVTANVSDIAGVVNPVFERSDNGVRIRGDAGTSADSLRQINADLQAWDGQGEFHSGFLRNTAADTPLYFSVSLYPTGDGRGEYVCIAQDVSKAYEREEAVRSALALAEHANNAKSRFLSNMSHDIRTPMNAIVNMTNFAMETIDDPRRQRKYLQTIIESSDHLLRLINETLDMSRIESGQTVIESEPFSLKTELMRLSDITRPLCVSKHITFLTSFDSIPDGGLLGDKVKVSQVLMNLLSNAVKYTPEHGAVRFTATEVPSLRADIATVRFSVEDNGIGISEEDVQRIFEPFARVNDRRVTEVEGTGLGLSICKSYVTAMGGTISCHSEAENGSTFTVELFFRRVDTHDEDKSRPSRLAKHWDTPFAGLRCLLCEDNDTNQIIARTLLERLGFLVELAADGKEGLGMFSASRDGYYDMIYMDIQMPVMDGYQAAVAIRQSGHPQAKTVPIIAITANIFAEDIEKARIAGMNGHLGKPIILQDLIEQTDAALQRVKERS